jgi:hypothetical protein
LRDARRTAPALDFALRLDHFVDRFAAKLPCDLFHSLGFGTRRRAVGAGGDLCVDVAFDLGLDRLMLHRAASFVGGEFVILHLVSP